MIRPILKFGDSVLHGKAKAVDAVTPDIDRLIDDLIETMYTAPGVGLAAPQVGVPLRIFVVDVSVGRDPNGLLIFVNPEFVERDGVQLEEEGCLSVPGFNATVMRPTRAVVKGLDRHGDPQQIDGSGLLARALTGASEVLWPRPRGRSGCVTTPTTVWGEARSRASSDGTANAGVPK